MISEEKNCRLLFSSIENLDKPGTFSMDELFEEAGYDWLCLEQMLADSLDDLLENQKDN